MAPKPPGNRTGSPDLTDTELALPTGLRSSRRRFLQFAGATAGILAVGPNLASVASAEPLVASGATRYGGITLSQSGYDYAPSVMYGDGRRMKMWWCGYRDEDAIFYAEHKGGEWSSPEVVLRSSDVGWDSVHVCDPSVVRGEFSADGSTWEYAMYYGGAADLIGVNTHIGVAFSDDGRTWQKYSGNPVIHPKIDPAPGYGAGMPSAYRHRHDKDTVTVAFYDSTDDDANHFGTADDGVHFGPRTKLTADENDPTSIGDIAFHRDEEVWYVSTKHNSDEKIYLYKTATDALDSAWTECGRIHEALTGNSKNHNPCWLRSPNGALHEEAGTRYKRVFFGTGDDSPGTWDLGTALYLDGWEFDVNGNREGWTSRDVSGDADEPTDGTWDAVVDGDDPQWHSTAIAVNADVVSTISIRLANENNDTTGTVYFRTADGATYDESRSVTFDVDDTGEWATYDVAMSSHAEWSGTVTGLRIDPVSTGSGDPLAISYIRLDG